MHENGKKHKENVERFLRNIYRQEEQTKKEDEKTKRELERIERAAMKQYKKDVGLSTTGSSITALRTAIDTATAQAPAPSTDERDAYYNTPYPEPIPLDLVANDPTSSPAVDSEVAAQPSSSSPLSSNVTTATITVLPEPKRDGSESMIGEWRPVTPPPPPKQNGESTDKKGSSNINDNVQLDEDEDEDPDDLRNFKVVEKTLPLAKEVPDDSSRDVALKKRKFGGKGKMRNTRKRTD